MNISCVDGEVLRCVYGVVVCVHGDVSAVNHEGVFALYAFAVSAAGGDGYGASADNDSSAVVICGDVSSVLPCGARLGLCSRLDALWRRVVLAAHLVGVSCVVGVLGGSVVVV